MTSITIDRRFCGPKASANGGYAAGRFASVIDGPAEVTLNAPTPFDTPIAFRDGGSGAIAAVCGGVEIALIKPAAVTIEAPPAPDANDVLAARDAYLSDKGMTLIYPYCFVCGKYREEGEGLRIFAGATPEGPVNADFWTPHASLADKEGLVAPEYLWAALDCPSAFALRGGSNPVLLGRFAADIARRPAAGETLTVAAWRTGADGRKHYSSSAIYDAGGAVIAAANATWIEINDAALIAKLRAENE